MAILAEFYAEHAGELDGLAGRQCTVDFMTVRSGPLVERSETEPPRPPVP